MNPGAGNVIPGLAEASLDVRHRDDGIRECAAKACLDGAQSIAQRRGVELTTEPLLDQAAVPCDSRLTGILARSVARAGYARHTLTSGAGHDAMIVAPHMPMTMLFVRSPGGISHHPAESVYAADVAAAIATGQCFLRELEGEI